MEMKVTFEFDPENDAHHMVIPEMGITVALNTRLT